MEVSGAWYHRTDDPVAWWCGPVIGIHFKAGRWKIRDICVSLSWFFLGRYVSEAPIGKFRSSGSSHDNL